MGASAAVFGCYTVRLCCMHVCCVQSPQSGFMPVFRNVRLRLQQLWAKLDYFPISKGVLASDHWFVEA